MQNNYFILFSALPSNYTLPEKFPSPFQSSPHPISILAAKELQKHLLTQTDWEYDFGLNQPKNSLRIGKMFGVLVVQNKEKELGYLAAFSGKLANKNHHPRFVPPVFDMLTKDSFLNVGMAELNKMNGQIKILESDTTWKEANSLLKIKNSQFKEELSALKLAFKQKKVLRDQIRQAAKETSTQEALNTLNLQLGQESAMDRKAFKKFNKEWKSQLEGYKNALTDSSQAIILLKEKRKKKSNYLQKQLFASYQFLNQAGQVKDLNDIFQDSNPVSGAGECAAPKLLQYAFSHQLKPIALAEFWWGKSPKSAIRQHGQFYPACEEKCRPILGYMLENLL